MNFEEEMDKETLKRLQEPEPTNAAIADGIQMILRHLWPKDELEALIDERHKALCSECPYRPKALELSNENDGMSRHERAIVRLYDLTLTVVKSPWFWIPVATVCAIVLSKYNLSLPMVGGGQ